MYKYNQSTPSYPTDWDTLVAALEGSGNYMKEVPDDPLGGTIHYYYLRSATDLLDYTLRACLENKSDPQGEADASCDSGLKFELNSP